MIENNCKIIVNSCDAYEDVWDPFFSALKNRWENCPYSIVLNTESKNYKFDNLDIVTMNLFNKSDKDLWGKRLRRTLQQIDSKYVISLFDDFILEDYVQQDQIEKCIARMEENDNIAVFYFSNIEGKNISDGVYEGFELLPQRKNYKLNSAPAIWRREKLLSFTGDKDSPWAWEFFGSARTYKVEDLFYCAEIGKENIYKYNYSLGGAIYRGKWVKKVIEPIIKEYNLQLDLSKRGFQDESNNTHRYSIMWKIKFVLKGFEMIGLDAFIFIFRLLNKRVERFFYGD
jgi:hypothetical protein